MKEFKNIKDLLEFLESDALSFKYVHQIANLFQKLRDLKHSENETEEVTKAQWEIDFFNFILKDGMCRFHFSATDDKGELFEYPSFNRFDEKTYQYLIERLNYTSNHLLRARYAHIIWCSPQKHRNYAQIAIDSYLELVKIYEQKDKESPNDRFGADILLAITNLYFLSIKISYKKDEVKSEIIRLISKFNPNSSYFSTLKSDLIKLMLEGKRNFSQDNFIGLNNICMDISNQLVNSGNIFFALSIFHLGERVDRKLKVKSFDWQNKIAELYEISMNQEIEKHNNLAAMTFCQSSMRYYKRLKNKEKIILLEKKYLELKSSIKLSEVGTEIDLTEHIENCKKFAAEIVKGGSEEITKVLMASKNILPRFKDMEARCEKYRKEFIFQSIFPTEIMDQSGHPSQHFSDEDELKYYGILFQYQFELEFNRIHLINHILFEAIRKNKLSLRNLLDFLRDHSWLGKIIRKELPNQKIIEYNWINLIAPSLHEYFLQMHYYFENPLNPPNFVLCIDSLTLKIEGLLRDICQFSAISTFYTTQDSKGRDIVREKDIHALLYEEPIKHLFDEDDLLLFKYVLVEKAGYNLRHRIAHSLMLFQEYNINFIHLLILIVLKLGKYDFVKKDISQEN